MLNHSKTASTTFFLSLKINSCSSVAPFVFTETQKETSSYSSHCPPTQNMASTGEDRPAPYANFRKIGLVVDASLIFNAVCALARQHQTSKQRPQTDPLTSMSDIPCPRRCSISLTQGPGSLATNGSFYSHILRTTHQSAPPSWAPLLNSSLNSPSGV